MSLMNSMIYIVISIRCDHKSVYGLIRLSVLVYKALQMHERIRSIDSKKAGCTTFIFEFVSFKMGAIATERDGKVSFFVMETRFFVTKSEFLIAK